MESRPEYDPTLYAALDSNDLTDEQRNELELAANWYYRAALNGRVKALHYYARVLDELYGAELVLDALPDDVDLSELSQFQQIALSRPFLYSMLIMQLVPGLEETRFGQHRMRDAHFFESPIQKNILENMRNRFLADQKNEPFGAPQLPDFTPFRNILEDYCQPVRDRYSYVSNE